MAKVLLVEDDNNLREIYEARLQAEGYETVTASDGEQALVVAKEAKPDLVISDVMMPKISGFEMLDILRNTDGLKDVKVIMLTALGQSEDKARADQLGADKYLVKSQVTLEDIVKTAHQLLDDDTPAATQTAPVAAAVPAPVDAASSPTPAAPAAVAVADASSTSDESAAMQAQIDNFAAQPATAAPAVPTEPVAAAPEPAVAPAPAPAAPAPAPADDTTAHDEVMAEAVDSLADASPDAQKPSDVTAVEVPPEPAAPAAPAAEPPDATDADEADDDSDGVTIGHKKIIKPISDPEADKKPSLNTLLAAEEAKVAGNTVAPTPDPATPVSLTEPAADPNMPNPNDVAL